MRHPQNPRVLIGAICLLVLLAAGFAAIAGGAFGRQGETSTNTGAPVTILSATDTDGARVTSIRLDRSNVVVDGVASGPGADATRTLWYMNVGGVAFAQTHGGTSIARRVSDSAGGLVDVQKDPLNLAALEEIEWPERSAEEIEQDLVQRAKPLGVTVREVNYIAAFGGTAEVVAEPDAPIEFANEAGTLSVPLIGDLGQDGHPYLLTVVDADGVPLMVLGYVPGLGGGEGQGIAWQAPSVDSSAIWGGSEIVPDSQP